MPVSIAVYDRESAVKYAHQWAFKRNPAFYDFEKIGGDCTNFASQCIFAGANVMNFTHIYGWYYRGANDKSPSWSGVEFLKKFLVGNKKGKGPFAAEVSIENVQPGDIVQLSFNGKYYQHSPVIVETGTNPSPQSILVAAHSIDSDNRALSTYEYKKIRFLHIFGVRS
jgi:hypothetical protein